METPSATSADDVASTLAAYINADIMAAGRSIGPEDAFEQAGVDSLALLRILVFVESSFGVWVPDEDLEEHVGCIRALAQYVAARAHAGS
jgi:acyl carrier protein